VLQFSRGFFLGSTFCLCPGVGSLPLVVGVIKGISLRNPPTRSPEGSAPCVVSFG
jgi:hypothetical protein